MADAIDSKSISVRSVGSSPSQAKLTDDSLIFRLADDFRLAGTLAQSFRIFNLIADTRPSQAVT